MLTTFVYDVLVVPAMMTLLPSHVVLTATVVHFDVVDASEM
jgi:hypothetical protein